jgi:ribonuclease PH
MNKPTNNNSANCPDESWDPLSFLNQADLKEFLEEKNKSHIEENEKKIDDDNPETISRQNFFLKVDCVTEASGSSYIEIGNCKILCSVFGPREIPRKDDYDFKIGNLNCEFRFASFSCFMQRKGTLSQKDQSLDEKNFSCIIEEALKPSILLHKYPKSQIDLYILCIQNDIDSKNILCASIIASSIAMANASIELYDLVASYTYIPVNLTIAYMPQLHQVTSLHFSNENNGAQLSVDLFKSHIKECIENCKKVYTYMKFVLLNGKDENENGQTSNGISHQEN